MKSKRVQRILRALVTLMGAGIGAGLTALAYQLMNLYGSWQAPQPYSIISIGVIAAVAGGLIFFLLSNLFIQKMVSFGNALERSLENMPMSQLLSGLVGLTAGLVIAALLTQILQLLGTSIITTTFSAIIYVVLGCVGLNIGRKRSREMPFAGGETGWAKERKFFRAKSMDNAAFPTPKILDTSVIIDGRVFDICKTGFVEGELVIPQFVLAELRHIADSSDALRRTRGRRGLDVLVRIQNELKVPVRIEETDYDDIQEVDVKLLRLAKQLNGIVVTNDYNLNKVAGVTGVSVLNINELANAVKPVVLPGEEMNVQIVKEGKEPGQGVAYLDDGTMIVVDNARRHLGESIEVVVTTVLQTSAGRMIFTRMKGLDNSKAC